MEKGTSGRRAVHTSSLALALLEGGKSRKRMTCVVADGTRLEFSVGLPRIWVDPENQEFGSESAKIHNPVDEGFRRILGRDLKVQVVSSTRDNLLRREDYVDRLVQPLLHRFIRQHADLLDRCRNHAGHTKPVAAVTSH